jgi:hypothetical protein
MGQDEVDVDARLAAALQRRRDRASARGDLLSKRFAESVLPLFVSDEFGRPRRLGSCVLVKVDGQPFAFTAAHVMTDAGDSLLHFGGGDGRKLTPLPCVKGFQSGQLQGIDFDVGLLPLSRSDLHLFAGYRFLGEADIDEIGRPDTLVFGFNSYSVFGYPASRSQFRVDHVGRHIKQASFHFTGLSEPLPVYVRERLDPEVHVIIEFDHADIRIAGRQITPPKLQGVSGGGIFHLDTFDDAAPTQLVAIATGHRRSARMVVGTRIEHFISAARRVVAAEPHLFA